MKPEQARFGRLNVIMFFRKASAMAIPALQDQLKAFRLQQPEAISDCDESDWPLGFAFGGRGEC